MNYLQFIVVANLLVGASQVLAADVQFDQKISWPRDCNDHHAMGHRKPGVFIIHLLQDNSPVKVYCEHSLNATATVILRRIAGDTPFNRPWKDYEYGFGNLQTDMWSGLKTINSLTSSGNTQLQINMQDWNSNNRNALYKHFVVSGASYKYRLSVSGYSGSGLVDDLSHNNGMAFATYDQSDINSCAIHQKGGWWYNYCSYTLPTGHYYRNGPYTPSGGFYDGIYYKDWLGFGYSLKYYAMLLTKP